MQESLLLTVKHAAQAGDDVLISPSLPADKYHFTDNTEKIKIITPENRVIEKDAEFGIPLGIPSSRYMILILNTQKFEIPIGSQIWIRKSLEQITHKPDITEV